MIENETHAGANLFVLAFWLMASSLALFVTFNCNSNQATVNPHAIPTFHSIGLYYSPWGASEDNICRVDYKILGEPEWRRGLDLWFDPDGDEYRGSLVNLYPGVTYKIKFTLEKTNRSREIKVTTWKEQIPVGDIVYLPDGITASPYVVQDSGTAEAYTLFTHPETAETIIDVNNAHDHNLIIDASYVIIRGLTLKNAGIHAIKLLNGAHDVIIEDCDISGWGRVDTDGFGVNEDAGIFSESGKIERIIIQKNKIHHPRSDANSWKEYRNKYATYHPIGPKAIVLKASAGNHVIRYNEIFSDDDHYFNDGIGESKNFDIGFPNADTDIYGNYIERCWDDAIESEGNNRNVRIWNNYIDRAYVGIALVPVEVGPVYIWRNVMRSSRKGPLPRHNTGASLIKAGGSAVNNSFYGDGKLYIFHNTSLIPTDPELSGHSNQINASGRDLKNCVTRNNILESQSDVHYAILENLENSENDFDYDLYNGEIIAVGGSERNGIQGNPLYGNEVGLDSDTGTGHFYLKSSSPGFDAGALIPNFNDVFSGEAPDMGAHEADSGTMAFGTGANYLNPNGLIGYWQFDEKRGRKEVIDKSGMGNHGRLYGHTVRRKGKFGRALTFRRDEDYVEIIDPGVSSLDVTRQLSISVWIKRTKNAPGDEWCLSKPGSYGWKISDNTPRFHIYTPDVNIIESTPIGLNAWHHMVAIYDFPNQVVKIYIDGELDTTQSVSGEIADSDESLMLGHPDDAYLNGRIDDVQIYNRALDEEEILDLYHGLNVSKR